MLLCTLHLLIIFCSRYTVGKIENTIYLSYSSRYSWHSPAAKLSSKYKALELASRILRKEGRHDAKKYIILIATRPSQIVIAYFKENFTKKDIILVPATIQLYKGSHATIKLKSSFYRGKALPLQGNLPFRKGIYIAKFRI